MTAGEIVAPGVIDEIGVLAPDATTVRPLPPVIGESDAIFVRGWALDAPRAAPALGVVIMLGEACCEAEYGLERFDIARKFGDDALFACGFRGSVTPRAGSRGPQNLRVFALGHDGRGLLPLSTSVRVEVTRSGVTLGLPQASSSGFALVHIDRRSRMRLRRGETFEIVGWAVDRFRGAPVRGVFLAVDDTQVVAGLTGRLRPDVAEHFGDERRLTSGFVVRFDTTGTSPGLHRLRLGFVDSAGGAHELRALDDLEILPAVGRSAGDS